MVNSKDFMNDKALEPVRALPSKTSRSHKKNLISEDHNGPEASPTKIKSTGRSESSPDKTMTSPVTNKNIKIRALGDFEKMYVLYVAMAEKPLSSGQKWFLR